MKVIADRRGKSSDKWSENCIGGNHASLSIHARLQCDIGLASRSLRAGCGMIQLGDEVGVGKQVGRMAYITGFGKGEGLQVGGSEQKADLSERGGL